MLSKEDKTILISKGSILKLCVVFLTFFSFDGNNFERFGKMRSIFKCWVLIRLNWAKLTISIYCRNCLKKRHTSSPFFSTVIFLPIFFCLISQHKNTNKYSFCVISDDHDWGWQFRRWCSGSEEAWWCCACCGWCSARPRSHWFSLWPTRRWCSSCWSCGSWRSWESAGFPRDSRPLPVLRSRLPTDSLCLRSHLRRPGQTSPEPGVSEGGVRRHPGGGVPLEAPPDEV